MNAAIPNSVEVLDTIKLDSGGHGSFSAGTCLMEAASYVAGEPFSDHPRCVSTVITEYGINLNDRLDDENRQKLKPFIPGMLNTAGDGLDDLRRYMLADWAIRIATPRWLDVAGLPVEAQRLRDIAPVADEKTLNQARDAARAVRAATYDVRTKRREELRDLFLAELKKNPDSDLAAVADAVAAAAAAAVADAVAVAAAVAVAVAVAVADAVAVAVAVADAVAVAAAAAAAAAAAVAAAVAAAAADAAADAAAAAAAAAKYSTRWGEVYRAVRAKLTPIYREAFKGSKYDEVREQNRAEGIELLGKILHPIALTD